MAFVPKQNICYLVKHENCNFRPVSLFDFHITYNNELSFSMFMNFQNNILAADVPSDLCFSK